MSYGTEVPGRCSECGKITDTLPCPHCIASVTQPLAPDRYLVRCRRCDAYKDMRVPCPYCYPDATCPVCVHPVREHSSEPGIGCLRQEFSDYAEYPGTLQCSCTLPGTSQADQ